MLIAANNDHALAARILRLDEASHTYAADRSEIPGAVLFTAPPGPGPSHNRAILGDVPTADADATLARIIHHFASRGAAPRVLVNPLARPPDWPDRLLRAGFVETDDREVFLTLPTAATIPTVPAVTVIPADTPDLLDQTVAVQMAGFGAPPEAVPDAQRRAHEGVTNPAGGWPHRSYLATLDDKPAGGATARFGPALDLTGVYGVATLPEARRRGVATALLARVLADAHAAGHELVFLAAQPGSYADSYYRRLGFVPRFEQRTFERPLGPGQPPGPTT